MEKKLQVFISSTYVDLIEERQTVVESVLNAGHIPAGMELFKAGPTQETIIREWIEASDVYLLILGGRYGSLNEEEISYTEWEYNLAKELNKPMFSIVLTEDYINQMVANGRIKGTDLELSNSKYINFKSEVQTSLNCQISHIAEIKGGVSDSLRDIEKRYTDDLVGWIPGSNEAKLNKLELENNELLKKLAERQEEVIDMQKEISAVKDDYIGDLSYSYIKEKLVDLGAEYKESILEANQDVELDIESEEIILDFLLIKKKEFIKGIKTNAFYSLLMLPDFLVSTLNQYSLLEEKINLDGSSVYIYTDSGKKFITLLEVERSKIIS